MPLQIVGQDITLLEVDAIVNAANPELRAGGGVCGAIFAGAGAELAEACEALAPIEVGEAVATPGLGLKAHYIIHAAGPIWRGGTAGEDALLRRTYRNSLALAEDLACGSIAFPLISAGIYGYPKQAALKIARETIQEFLRGSEMEVTLAIFDRESFVISQGLYENIQNYLDERYVEAQEEKFSRYRLESQAMVIKEAVQAPRLDSDLADWLDDMDVSFSEHLFLLIDQKGLAEVDVYKRANLDRKLFSKIRSNPDYRPTKPTALALAIGMQLSLKETEGLLDKAGFSLSRSQKFDIIVEYFLARGNYNIFEINEALFAFDQKLLG